MPLRVQVRGCGGKLRWKEDHTSGGGFGLVHWMTESAVLWIKLEIMMF